MNAVILDAIKAGRSVIRTGSLPSCLLGDDSCLPPGFLRPVGERKLILIKSQLAAAIASINHDTE